MRAISLSDLVRGISILSYAIGTNSDGVNVKVLEKRPHHRIADHDRRYAECDEFERCQSGTLVIRCGLGVECFAELLSLEKVSDESERSTVALLPSFE